MIMKSIAKPSYKTIIFRNIALTLYLVIGGAVFQLCEKQHYISSSHRYKHLIELFRKRYNITSDDMQHLQDILHNGRTSVANEWSYSNAVFFAGTTVLTVGKSNFLVFKIKLHTIRLGYLLRGYSFSTYAQRGRGGSSKSVRHAYMGGEGLTHGSTYAKTSLFCTCFVIFSNAGSFYHALLSLA